MKIYSYISMVNENGNPYIQKKECYQVDGRKTYNTPSDIFNFVYDGLRLQDYAEEYVYILCLDNKGHLLGCFEVSHGTTTCSLVTPRETFQKALMIGAVNIIMTHNHPSGDITPSKADIDITERIYKAGDIIGVNLLDHIIICKTGYCSMKMNGYMRGE